MILCVFQLSILIFFISASKTTNKFDWFISYNKIAYFDSSMIVGINGFGRIGKQVYRILVKNGIKVALVNDPALNMEEFFYQARYDTVYGIIDDISMNSNSISAHGIETALTTESSPKNIPWAKYKVDFVVESSGIFKTQIECSKHNAKRVILTCPSEDIPMFIFGVNHLEIKDQKVISAASCTTNCLVPLAKLVHDNFKIEEGFVSTIHSMTGTQKCVDGKGKNHRIGRCAMNIIPSTTGAAFATEKILPELKGKITAMAFRVPIPSVSLIDFVIKTSKPTSLEKIKKLIEKQKDKYLRNILGVTDEELVSSDYIGDTRSSVLDIKASVQLSPTSLKLVSWYDNEYGYSCRIADILFHLRDLHKTSNK